MPEAAKEEARDEGPSETRRQRLARRLTWIRDHYCRMDPRTAGIFRLGLGFLLTADCLRHWKVARWFYSNEGVLSNHYHLFRPDGGYNFSLYHSFSTLPEVHIAFALSTLAYFLFFIGWHARLFSVISFVLVTSMDQRILMIENGGYIAVNLLACWAMFLPTDRRFSVDAIVRSLRERREASAEDLNQKYRPPRETEIYTSGMAMLAVVNLAAVYFFNVINKSGRVWHVGDTVHYVLYLNRMVTGVGVFLREILPYPVTRGLTWMVLAHEAVLCTLILSPYGRRYTRPLAMLGVTALHGAFGVVFRLGPFSWFMIGWSLLLLTPENWDDLEGWYRRRARARVVVYDGSSPLAFAFARLLSRLDGLDLLTFEASAEAESGAIPPLVAARDPETGAIFTGSAAVREIAQALPGGRYLRPVLTALTLGLAVPLLRLLSRRRAEVARFFDLTIPPGGAKATDARLHEERPRSPLGLKIARGRLVLREALIGFLAICAVWTALQENKNVPAHRDMYTKTCAALLSLQKRIKGQVTEPAFCNAKEAPKWLTELLTMPKVMIATVYYPRIMQGWGMFAPNPITDDGSLSIDAVTIDGRRIDPFTGKAPDLDISDAPGLGLGQIWQDYFNRIRGDGNKVFRPQLQEYLLRWHKETGRPEDEIVAFDVYWVTAQCPKPGSKKMTNNKPIAILSYRKPGYKPAPGLPPLPPELKVESAGK